MDIIYYYSIVLFFYTYIYMYVDKKKRYTNKSWYCTRWKTIFYLLEKIPRTPMFSIHWIYSHQYRMGVLQLYNGGLFFIFHVCVWAYFFFWRYYHKIQFTPQFFFLHFSHFAMFFPLEFGLLWGLWLLYFYIFFFLFNMK